MARFYADENFRRPVVEALRHLGHDVLTAQEAGRGGLGIDDDTVLADAAAAGTRKQFMTSQPLCHC